jgi:hypothetical protein
VMVHIRSLIDDQRKHGPEVHIGNALVNESDRGCILVGCAYLEFVLESLLRAYFYSKARRRHDCCKNDLDLIENVINPQNPMALLGTGWSKSTIAHLLELIDRLPYEGNDKIRKMRIDCAHRPGVVVVDDSLISELLNTIAKIDAALFTDINTETEQYFAGGESYWHFFSGHRNFTSARVKFMHACLLVCSRMAFNLLSYELVDVEAYVIGHKHLKPGHVHVIHRSLVEPSQAGSTT